MLQGVEGAGLDQGLHSSFVQCGQVGLVEEVGEGSEFPFPAAGVDDGLDDVVADVAYGPQPEPYVVADGGELGDGLVHVGLEDPDAVLAGVGKVDRGLVLVVADRGEQGGHVLGRVVGLEVGGPV